MKTEGDRQAELRQKIRQLVLEGNYPLRKDEANLAFEQQFYDEYESVIEELEMGYIPIQLNRQRSAFQILPQFLNHTNDYSLRNYRLIFSSRFNDVFVADESPDIEEEDYGKLEYIVHRSSNYTYAYFALKEMLESPDRARTMDPYGWIENRKKQFYIGLEEMCADYKLPLLPVNFERANHIPEFMATKQEVVNFYGLWKSRSAIDVKITDTEKDTKRRIKELSKDLSQEDRSDAARKLHLERVDRIETIQAEAHSIWAQENEVYQFPSKVDFYHYRLIEKMQDNQDCTTISYIEHLPTERIPIPENDVKTFYPN